MVGQWPASEAVSTSLRCGPRSLCQRIIGLKYFYGGPEGWGLTYPASNPVNSCSKSSISVLPQIGVVLPNSIKGQCHNHPIGLPSSSSRVRLCIFLAVVLTHFERMGGGYRPLRDSLVRAGFSSQESKLEQNISQRTPGVL